MSGRLVTEDKLRALLARLEMRFTVADLHRVVPMVGLTSRTQARYWLLRHAPGQPALVHVAERVRQPRGRPTIVYEVTAFGQQWLATGRAR